MVRGGGGDLVGQSVLAPLDDALVVAVTELDLEGVRDDGPATERGGALVHLLLDGGGDLHRLDLGAERLGEGGVDHAFDTLLEAVDDPHGVPPSSVLVVPDRAWWACRGSSGWAALTLATIVTVWGPAMGRGEVRVWKGSERALGAE